MKKSVLKVVSLSLLCSLSSFTSHAENNCVSNINEEAIEESLESSDSKSKSVLTHEQLQDLINTSSKFALKFAKGYEAYKNKMAKSTGEEIFTSGLMGAFAGPWAGAAGGAWLLGDFGGDSMIGPVMGGFLGFWLAIPTIVLAPVTAPIGAAVGGVKLTIERNRVKSNMKHGLEELHDYYKTIESVDISKVDDEFLLGLKKIIEAYKFFPNKQDVKNPEDYFPSLTDKDSAIYGFVKAILEKAFQNVSPEFFIEICNRLEIKNDSDKLSTLASMYFLLKTTYENKHSLYYSTKHVDFLRFAFLPQGK